MTEPSAVLRTAITAALVDHADQLVHRIPGGSNRFFCVSCDRWFEHGGGELALVFSAHLTDCILRQLRESTHA